MKIWPDRPLTGIEAGMVLALGLMLLFCCLGVVALSLFSPPPAAAPIPTPGLHTTY